MRHSAKITLLSMMLGIVGLPSGAAAQAQGPGFQTGPLTLHMGLGAEFGYDSNLYLSNAAPQDSFMMRLRAHLEASTHQDEETNPAVVFAGGVNATFFHFFADTGRDNVAVGANVSAHFRPDANVSFRLADTFARTVRPFVDGDSGLRFARDVNTVDAVLHFRSDSDVLQATLGYQLVWDFFEDRNAFGYAGGLTHAIRTGAYWAFLPQTGFVYEGQVERANFDQRAGAAAFVPDGWRIRQEVGLNGAITRAFSLTAMVGYSAGYFDGNGPDYGLGRDALTARAEARFQPLQNLQLKLGYQRKYNASSIGNFARHDRLYLGGQLALGDAFTTGLDFAAIRSVTGTAFAADGVTLLGSSASREAWRLTTTFNAEYRATQWLAVTLNVAHLADFTDYTFADAGGLLIDPAAEFSKFEAWLGLRVFY